jgi:hypothetical protein
MISRLILASFFCLSVSVSVMAQASRDARFKIIGTIIAEQAAARISMPFGTEGVELTDTGTIDQAKVDQQIKKNGKSIEPGKVVTISAIEFNDNSIEFELDGGGKNKKAWYDRIEVGMGGGGRTTPVSRGDESKAKGSKIVLRFAKKVPPEITPDQLHALLDPVLDFNKRSFMQTGIDSLPTEFQEAVKAKKASIGMDKGTVIMAMGRPDKKFNDKDEQGTAQETWLYSGKGMRTTFVWFQNEIVVKIAEY